VPQREDLMKARLPVLKGYVKEHRGAVGARSGGEEAAAGILAFSSRIGSTCDLGVQTIVLTPGASSCCGNGACSSSSCCCW